MASRDQYLSGSAKNVKVLKREKKKLAGPFDRFIKPVSAVSPVSHNQM